MIMPSKPKASEPKDNDQPSISEAFQRMLLATIGAAAIAKDKVETLLDRLVERGEIVEKDGKKLRREMMEKRKARANKVEQRFRKHIENMHEQMNIASRDDVEALSQKITALSEKIDEMKNS
jgi:poly(hydroxyalkanoate) granule-associated protein